MKHKLVALKPNVTDWSYRGHTIHQFLVSFDRDEHAYQVDGSMEDDFDSLIEAQDYIDRIVEEEKNEK